MRIVDADFLEKLLRVRAGEFYEGGAFGKWHEMERVIDLIESMVTEIDDKTGKGIE